MNSQKELGRGEGVKAQVRRCTVMNKVGYIMVVQGVIKNSSKLMAEVYQ